MFEEIFNQVREMLSEYYDIDADSITPETNLCRDLGWSHDDIEQFEWELENEFMVTFGNSDVIFDGGKRIIFENISDIVRYIDEYEL